MDLPAEKSGGFFMSNRRITVYDTTLRDGAQGPAVSFSASDKVRIARTLDELGFDYVEGGVPGSNPQAREALRRAASAPARGSTPGGFRSDAPSQRPLRGRRQPGRPGAQRGAGVDAGGQERLLAGRRGPADDDHGEPRHGRGIRGV